MAGDQGPCLPVGGDHAVEKFSRESNGFLLENLSWARTFWAHDVFKRCIVLLCFVLVFWVFFFFQLCHFEFICVEYLFIYLK